jgi:hypothetical protein
MGFATVLDHRRRSDQVDVLEGTTGYLELHAWAESPFSRGEIERTN